MKNILKKGLFIGLLLPQLLFTQAIWADSLAKFESELIRQYAQSTCRDRFECDQYNQQIAEAIEKMLQQSPQRFDYSFPQLQQQGMLRIVSSPDQKYRFYTMDVSGGGTMREYYTLYQFKQNQNNTPQILDLDDSHLDRVYAVELQGKTVYLMQSTFVGSLCDRTFILKAFYVEQNSLKPAAIFTEEGQAKQDELSLNNQCRWGGVDSDEVFRISNSKKYIDIMIMPENENADQRYQRYEKTAQGYQKTDMVK